MAQFFLKIAHLSFSMGPTPILKMAVSYGLHPRLWLLISLNLCLIVLFTYTVDLPFFIGTTQGESTINCGGVVDPNYFCFSQVMLLTYSPQEIFFMYGSLKSLSDEKLRGDVYNTLLFDFAK